MLVLIAIFARSLPDSGVLEEEILKLLCFAGLEGSGFRFALEGLCCEKNHHKSKFLSSCQQQEFRCRNEVVSKQNPPQVSQYVIMMLSFVIDINFSHTLVSNASSSTSSCKP